MGKKNKIDKTNAVRILETENIGHRVQVYDVSDGKIDGVSVADKINTSYESVFKTLVARANSKTLYVYVIPVDKTLDLKKAAQIVGEKKIEMIHVKELVPLTGYQKGGCSPVGMKKSYATVIDESCLDIDEIIVSAGKIGMQLILQPKDLIKVVGAKTGDITRED